MIPTNDSRQQGRDTEDVIVDVQCMFGYLIILWIFNHIMMDIDHNV